MSIQTKIFPSEARDHVQRSRAFLSVSLSNRLTESPSRLREVLIWLQRSVASFDVVIGDYYHRHNIEDLEGYRPAEALALSTTRGKQHAQHVRSELHHLGLSDVKIVHTVDLSAEPSFSPALREMEALWWSHPDFARFIDEGTDAFLQRLAPDRIGLETARAHSRQYQLEELATFLILAARGYTTNVYAGAHLPVMKALVNGELRDLAPDLIHLHLVELRMRGGA